MIAYYVYSVTFGCLQTTSPDTYMYVYTVEPGIMHTIRGRVRCAVWQGVQYEKYYVYPRDCIRGIDYEF